MGDDNGGGLRLGSGAILQIVTLVAAVGIAWGTLSTKQSALAAKPELNAQNNAAIMLDLRGIKDQLSELQRTVSVDRYSRAPRIGPSEASR